MSIKRPINCVNCKARAELVQNAFRLYQCRCTGCGSIGRLAPYKSDAVTYWNEEHRPEPETLPESLAFVSISAEEYAEYVRLKEAAKPLSIDEMREYCIEWFNRLGLDRNGRRDFGPIRVYNYNGHLNIGPLVISFRTGDEEVASLYAIIRAIELLS